MKALILAAGLGTRLAPITNDVPKSLVPVNGKPILIKQIENLYQNDVTDITIISGYKASVLKDVISGKYPEIKIIDNVDYKITNNMYSAYLGKDAMGSSEFLMMNADVFYDASVIKSLLLHEAPNAIVTDLGTYIDESMKVVEKNGRLVEISKQISPEEALGASIDVYKFSPDAGACFFEKCREFIEDKNELQLWSEVALNAILQAVEFVACPLDGRWLEIDNHEDLAAAEKLFA
ncbi:TPA: phosphocholine cytidylyltransferase family protein [Streptococcus pneumoniae]|uniref:Nucleotidyl transferase Gtp2 n=2 Tax=Streptococcus pneumoniae TaxID=1313 RepID=A0A1A9BJH3_STREE|nr:phosphocholine cytidylyltransferase family protein [Streptococcus pneumoniae]MBS4111344.1 phosphocholine cytidylyltransferase family protein [Streptococcus pneumoniae]MBW7521978.1 phosphocholine cytidylyltransferase family protein [Streptococcus pneumoniae]MDG9466848.1 phosphocholine cytidylyltransferase family protein [Streptococcus pneumoniae]MDH7682026.1 phosphocholine cytidylyltransferase family protein [Streptococcus pneumoniae]MDH7722315.1 phosphocholine cytidylyltransferase family pr